MSVPCASRSLQALAVVQLGGVVHGLAVVGLGAVLQQQADDRHVVADAGPVQRGDLALLVAGVEEHMAVRIGAVREQQLGATQDVLLPARVEGRRAQVQQRHPAVRLVPFDREPRLDGQDLGHEVGRAGTARAEHVRMSNVRRAPQKPARHGLFLLADRLQESLGLNWSGHGRLSNHAGCAPRPG